MGPELHELVEQLRSRGHRITRPRRWTLAVLYEENRHMTCEEVQQGLARRGVQVDDATVYRTLQWLKQNRIVSQMTRGTGADVYRSEEHTSELQSRPHLVCRLLLEKKKTSNHQQHY